MKTVKRNSYKPIEFRMNITIRELILSGYTIDELVDCGLLQKEHHTETGELQYFDSENIYNELGQKIDGKTN